MTLLETFIDALIVAHKDRYGEWITADDIFAHITIDRDRDMVYYCVLDGQAMRPCEAYGLRIG